MNLEKHFHKESHRSVLFMNQMTAWRDALVQAEIRLPRSLTIRDMLMYLVANSAFWVPFARVGLQVAGFLENIEYTCRVTERIRGNRLKVQQNLVNTNPCFLAASMRSTRPNSQYA